VKAHCLLAAGFFWVASGGGRAALEGPGSAVTPAPEKSPWAEWFTKNVLVTDKKTYVHFFWNANEARQLLEGKDRKERLAEAARDLVRLHHPASAAADRLKVDIVYVLERDNYGSPRWETLRRVAHLECSRKKLLESGPRREDLIQAFDKFEMY
jgi:hypothetical protein